MAATEEIRVAIRKLRKKLRQIENLERLDRELNDEEIEKVLQRDDLRARIQDYLSQYPGEADVSFASNASSLTDTSWGAGGSPRRGGGATYGEHQYQHSAEEEEEKEGGYYDHDDDDDDESGDDDQEEEDDEDEVADPKEQENNAFVEESDADDEMEEKEGEVQADWKVVTEKKTKPDTAQSGDVNVTKVEAKQKTLPKKEEKIKLQVKANPKEKKVSEEVERSRAWRKYKFSIKECVGHNDLVNSVDMDEDIVITGSRDTTIKVWQRESGEEVRSLGGHTMSVTAVLLIPKTDTQTLSTALGLADCDRLILSASQDCHIKLWNTKTGEQVRSLYTYNPVTCLAFINTLGMVIAGSDGGKIESWDIVQGQQVQSLRAEEIAITALQYSPDYVFASSADGLIRVYHLRDCSLHLVFMSESVTTKATAGATATSVLRRHVRSLATSNGTVYYGDDGMNVKVLDWRKNCVSKLANHRNEFGSTDAMTLCGPDLLLTSGYDLDNGIGYLNVRSLPNERYLGTLCCEDTGRIMAVSAVSLSGRQNRITLVTAGTDVKLWTQTTTKEMSSEEGVVGVHFVAKYERPPRNSDVESEWSDTEDEDEEEEDSFPRKRREEEDQEEKGGWTSWCSLL